ncbi:MAG TPA: hypothetical protein VJN18_30510 [Polyangiaceae bacterium]|nr:hypothetical protein [Polyangiaceae bacterium]
MGGDDAASDEALAAALASTGTTRRPLRVRLEAPHDEGALVRLIATASKADVPELLLDWGRRTLAVP